LSAPESTFYRENLPEALYCAVELVLFVGIQGSGKSSFYRERFAATHLRLNRDMLKTRHRERRFLEACLETQQRVAIDNTNPRRIDRADYIALAKAANFRIIGYYFKTTVVAAIARNEQRIGAAKIPKVALFTAQKRLEVPAFDEGFDQLYCVTLDDKNHFTVEPATPDNMVKWR
jgi:predicted kinase